MMKIQQCSLNFKPFSKTFPYIHKPLTSHVPVARFKPGSVVMRLHDVAPALTRFVLHYVGRTDTCH